MLGNISMVQLLILLVIIVLLFGTKKLRNIGGDLGSAIKGFKKGLSDDEDSPKLEADPEPEAPAATGSEKVDASKEKD